MGNMKSSKETSTLVMCKKHPKHKQSPGVCSICLRERLSRLESTSSSSRKYNFTAVSSSLSSLSSSYSSSCSSGSSCSSPTYAVMEGKGSSSSISFLFRGKSSSVLTKSRSLDFVSRVRGKEDDPEEKRKGFLSRLLRGRRPRKNQMEETLHSRTVRERVMITS